MLPELLGEIIRRVEASEDKWPHRQNVVACACVRKRWRDITKEITRSPSYSGKITFPSCLKQPRILRVLYFVGAGFICTIGINKWREMQRKSMALQQQQLPENAAHALE